VFERRIRQSAGRHKPLKFRKRGLQTRQESRVGARVRQLETVQVELDRRV
jgi:hypothetical protein